MSVKTPGKPADQPRRLRNRGVALSIADIRKAAMKLRERGSDSTPRTDPDSRPDEDEVTKPKKLAATEIELPEKYELLDKFFNSLDFSIRLLQIKKSATIFSNISPKIESLTDRRFEYGHLAQLKFLVPEAIVLEKILVRDERTSCMKPDLRITLDVEAIKSKGKSKSISGNLQMRKVFRSRLLKFFKSHPEGDEVPEEELPQPFGRLKEDLSTNSAHPSGTNSVGQTQGVAFSGLPPSFKRSFSLQNSGHQLEKLKEEQPLIDALPSVKFEHKFAGGSTREEICKIPRSSGGQTFSSVYELSSDSKTLSNFPVTPVKSSVNFVEDEDQCSDKMTSVLSTPVAMASTPMSATPVLSTPVVMASTPMSATPVLQPTKRCYMSPDDKESCRTPSKLVRRPPANRPLKFDTPVKNVKNNDEDGWRGNPSTRGDIFSILPQSLIQSIQEKERLALHEQEPAISQAMRRRKLIAGLPKLFDRIIFFFQSIGRSVVTKEELIHKLITQLDVVIKKDVEEQLRLLQELAPEWIYEKSVLSGDLLICIKKISNSEAIRTRLSEAI